MTFTMDYFILTIAIAIALAILFLFLAWLKKKLALRKSAIKKKIDKKFQEISQLLAIDSDAAYKTAVIESDKLLDFSLQFKKVRGTTLGERLKNSQRLIKNLNDVWFAHKVRNRLVHELDSNVKRKEASRIVKIFKKAVYQIISK